jgi:hypothetical protein
MTIWSSTHLVPKVRSDGMRHEELRRSIVSVLRGAALSRGGRTVPLHKSCDEAIPTRVTESIR